MTIESIITRFFKGSFNVFHRFIVAFYSSYYFMHHIKNYFFNILNY